MLIDNHQIALEEKWKDRVWCRQVLKDIEYRFLEQTIPVMRKVYGNNWDLELIFENCDNRIIKTNQYGYAWTEEEETSELSSFNFKIHFPEICIENSNGNTRHIIKDLFIKLNFDAVGNYIDLNKMQGLRSTVSEREYKKGYAHSHLHSKIFSNEDSRSEFTNFCLGEGALKMMEMKMMDIVARISNADNFTLDTNTFKLFLLQIKEYVVWESLEGIPYMYIEKIDILPNSSAYSEAGDNYSSGSSLLERLMSRFEQRYNEHNLPPLKWGINNGQFKLKTSSYLHDLLLPFVDENYHFYKDERGKYYKDSELTPGSIATSTDLFIYQGRQIVFNVYENSTPPVLPPNRQKYVHYNIINHVKSEYESKLNKKAFINSYLRNQNSCSIT